ncbi:hypothetical protein Lal_00038503 [Lupinus albus]|uniref:Putative triacylglycerol lipase n=1 Tax=Lupinus albus TaxID=3870 RepID=A0A6A4NXU2_LUPAL|nr:putative triacylglycerol lipase [Lupinus albus]KAF1881862.1 hypothetical protein Lal_00038503 [Lupinus albus]
MYCESKIWLALSLLFVANYNQNYVHGESKVPCIFIFGDSLSDSGNNNNLATNAKSNFKPYGIDFPTGPTGRFTNGRNTIDIITQFLGFENFIPPFANTSGSDILKGVNYASGSAGIRDESGGNRGAHISLGLQLENHRLIVTQIASKIGGLKKAKKYLSKCLYYVNIGSNDYLNNYFLPEYYPTSTIYTPHQYAEALIQQLTLNLQVLEDVGARKYVLVGLGSLGCTPFHISDGSCFEPLNTASLIFSQKLKSLVDQLNNKTSTNSKFIFLNSTTSALINAKGFTVTTVACCASGSFGECIPDRRPCPNRTEYVFWDENHTTEAWNLVTATIFYNSSYPDSTYPMNIKQFVEQDIKMKLQFISQPGRFYADE